MNIKIPKITLQILFVAVAMLLVSCYPQKPDDLDELDVVQTQYDEDFNFDSKDYYLLPDTLPVITNVDGYQKSDEEINLDENVVNEIALQMERAGYERVSLADTANEEIMDNAFIVLASRSSVVYSESYYDYYYYGYDYWDWYYGLNYYYPGYNTRYYYPWGYPVTYAYEVGTVIIELVDPGNPVDVDEDSNEVSYPVRWMAILNGLAELSFSNTEERITNGIQQAFAQSPYLIQNQ